MKQWHKYAHDYYIDLKGKGNSAEIQKHLKLVVLAGELTKMPEHINSIQKYVAQNREKWNDELIDIDFMNKPVGLQMLELNKKLKKIIALLGQNQDSIQEGEVE